MPAKTKPRGERKEDVICVRFKPEVIAAIQRAVAITGLTKSGVIHMATLKFLYESHYWKPPAVEPQEK